MKYIKSYKLFESVTDKLYHGNRKGDFPPEKTRFAGAIFLTSNLKFAEDFAGFDERAEFPEGAVWEVKLKPNLKICDPIQVKIMKELDLKSILQKMIDSEYEDPTNGKKFESNRGKGFKGYDYETNMEFDLEDTSQSVYNYLWLIKNGSWRIIECKPIISKIKSSGYDGFKVTERGSKNVAIFDESSIEKFEKMKYLKKYSVFENYHLDEDWFDVISLWHDSYGYDLSYLRHVKKKVENWEFSTLSNSQISEIIDSELVEIGVINIENLLTGPHSEANTIRVKSITGTMDEEYSDFQIYFSNNDYISIDIFLTSGPDPRKDYVKIKANILGEKLETFPNLVDEYNMLLEINSDPIISQLELYKKLVITSIKSRLAAQH